MADEPQRDPRRDPQRDSPHDPLLDEHEIEEALHAGATLFDAGAFWEAHEAWEMAWHRAPPEERDFFQGLIHAAAACLHHQRGNAYGVERQQERMVRRLGPFDEVRRGVAVRALVRAVTGLPPAGTPTEYPVLRLTAPR